MKKVLSIITLALLVGYIIFATIALCHKPAGQTCRGIRLEIRDSLNATYMSTTDIVTLLTKNQLNPTGQALDKVSLTEIEQTIETSPLIASCECYKTINGYVVVEVECRRPILRVIAETNDSYYLDQEGKVIERISSAVYVPVATGYISRKFAQESLLDLARYLQDEKFWNAQIEQIHVTPRGEIELTSRVGDHVIVLGRPGNYAEKFDKLRAFYEKGLSEVGWNRYSRINVDYAGQVVATKR